MIFIQIHDSENVGSKTIEIPSEFGPALRSTIEEHANELGERISGSFDYDREDAYVRATAAFNQLRAAINAVVPNDDPFYRPLKGGTPS